MSKLKRFRTPAAVLAVILGVYFVSRLVSIDNFPIFTDEAIYLRWAQIAKNDANWRFISLTDGKQPLFVWLTMILMRVISDPIIAGRLISVFAGAVTITGLVLLGKVVFKRWATGIISALFYLVLPFSLVYDRMAMMDGLLACFMVWSLLFEVILVKTLRLDVAMILGGVIGLGLLTKTSAFFALYLLPFSLLVFDFNKKDRLERLVKWAGLALVAIFISQIMYAVLRLSPFFHMIGQKDQTFIFSFGSWLKHPFKYFPGNLDGLLNWFTIYLTTPLVVFLLFSLAWGLKFIREKLLIFIWFIVPFIALAFFGFVLYPRFIFFMVVPLLLLAGYSLNKIADTRKWLALLLLLILFIMPGIVDFALLRNPVEAKIPTSDSNQYFNDWPSGWGIKESNDFFRDKSKNTKIAVYTEGTFGLLPAAVELYLADNENVYIKGIWPVPPIPPREMREIAKSRETYMIFFQNPPPADWPLKLIFKTRKGKSERYNFVYQFIEKK